MFLLRHDVIAPMFVLLDCVWPRCMHKCTYIKMHAENICSFATLAMQKWDLFLIFWTCNNLIHHCLNYH